MLACYSRVPFYTQGMLLTLKTRLVSIVQESSRVKRWAGLLFHCVLGYPHRLLETHPVEQSSVPRSWLWMSGEREDSEWVNGCCWVTELLNCVVLTSCWCYGRWQGVCKAQGIAEFCSRLSFHLLYTSYTCSTIQQAWYSPSTIACQLENSHLMIKTCTCIPSSWFKLISGSSYNNDNMHEYLPKL